MRKEKAGGPAVKVTIADDDALALHWLLRHLSFSDALESTPPHLGEAVRKDRAYAIVNAAARLQDALEKADHYGDGWMYRETVATNAGEGEI